MAGVEFDVADVKAKVSKDPWKRQEDFSDEINTEDMADTATQYLKAGAEAGSAGELGENASQQSAESGSYNGEELLDKEQRDSLTSQDLGNNGEQMDAVVGNLMRAMATAMDAEDDVKGEISGSAAAGAGLEAGIQGLSLLATSTYNDLKSSAAALPAATGVLANANLVEKPTALFDGTTYDLVNNGADGWSLPSNLVSDIKNYYLDKAVEKAEDTDGEIKDIIDKYRQDMNELGLELEEAGYDTSEGPLELWHSEEMAAYNGNRLNEELQKEDPDVEAIARYTSALGAVTESMFDENGNVREDFNHLDSDLDEYVSEFFEDIDAEALAALGNMESGEGGAAETVGASQRNVANGINVLTNPDVGGIDTSQTGADKEVPEGVAEYVYGYDEKLDELGVAPGSGLRSSLNEFDGFGALMSKSTVESGHGFSGDMARAAIDVQKTIESKNEEIREHNGSYSVGEMRSDSYPPLDSENIGGLLTAASQNEGASAHMLSDPDFAHDLMMREWHNGAGAGDLIRAGTTMPQGLDPNSASARPFFTSAGNVLETAGANQARLTEINDGPWDTSELHAAIGDTAVSYMDLLSSGGTTGASGPGEVTVFGQTYEHGFKLSTTHTNALFDLMLSSDEEVSTNFLEGVGAWQYGTAYSAMSGEEPDERNVHAASDAVMRVSGYIDGSHEAAASAGARASDIKTSMIVGATTLAGKLPGAGLVATAGGEFYRHLSPSPVQSGAELSYANDLRGDIYPRHIIASAGRDANYEGMGDEELSTLTPGDQATTDAESRGDEQRRQDIDADNALNDLRYLESEYGYLYGHEAYTDGRVRPQ